jgi:hypothetical protein
LHICSSCVSTSWVFEEADSDLALAGRPGDDGDPPTVSHDDRALDDRPVPVKALRCRTAR